MIEKIGNLLAHLHEADLLLFTANSYIRQDGRLTMGAGFAKQVRDKFPGLDAELGSMIKPMSEYGLCLSSKYPVGAFQTKTHFGWPSDLALIDYSVKALCNYLYQAGEQPVVYMNYPGIGLGGLKIEKVRVVLGLLPDNVTVWRRSPFN